MVRTNTCYQVVATISLQFLSATNLKQALAFLREVNPGWNPQCFMMHNTQQDIDVVQQVFPDAEIHIFDNCLQNSMKKWLGRNCKDESDMERVYQLIQATAMSRTEEESNQAWEKVTQLGLWRFNASFRYYMTHTWMQSKKRWCHYSRSDPLIVTLTVNNGLEQLSSALKHDRLDDLKTRSLTEIFSGIVSDYLPAHYCRHMSQNLVLPALANHTKKKSSVPSYIKNTPPLIQAHITELIKSMPHTAEVTKCAEGHFIVIFPDSPSCNLTYGNELHFPSCSCPYWQETRMICHHFCVIFGSFPEYGWDALSVRYINNPIFSVDMMSLHQR
ncbi:uncharacterized protein [Amphiura filiformis]|uniref:uncharacterized protein isoform X1 n=1 Tax=Amphiura filiformis TaxID=82378 RepID=UPI003B20C4A8